MARARSPKGETRVVEWKESWRDDYLRWLCGFANADGGTLVIGKNDTGEPVGAPDAQRLLVDLPNKIRDTLGLVVPVRAVKKNGKTLAEIEVEASPTPISYRGEYHFRSGSTKQQLTGNALDVPAEKAGSPLGQRAGARRQHPRAEPDRVQALQGARARGGAAAAEGAYAEACRAGGVERLRLTEAGMLKRAALLLFHEAPERWFTGAYVKISMFRSESDLTYHDEVRGDLFTQMDQTVELLRQHLLPGRTDQGVGPWLRENPRCLPRCRHARADCGVRRRRQLATVVVAGT